MKKQEARYVEKHPRLEQKEQGIKITWESGFGVENEGDWTPIDKLKTKIVYEVLTKKRKKSKTTYQIKHTRQYIKYKNT